MHIIISSALQFRAQKSFECNIFEVSLSSLTDSCFVKSLPLVPSISQALGDCQLPLLEAAALAGGAVTLKRGYNQQDLQPELDQLDYL